MTRLVSGLARQARRIAKLAWWTLSLQLPARLAARRRAASAGADMADVLAPAPAAPAVTGASAPRRMILVSGEPDTPGHIYRIARYAAAATSLGLEAMVLRLDAVPAALPPLRQTDVVLVWRAVWDDIFGAIHARVRDAGATLVFDIDDLMIDPDIAHIRFMDGIRSEGASESHLQAQFRRFQQAMLHADACTATTEQLAREMRRFHTTCFVLPNTFDDDAFLRARLGARRRTVTPDDGFVRLGYAGGTRTHQKDFLLITPALSTLLRTRPQCRLVLFRAPGSGVPLVDISEFPALAGLDSRIEWRDAVPLRELPAEVARFDINLAPLETGNRFCEAKSELKYFEAAIAGVCTVASPTDPFQRAIRHGQTGFLAETEAEWTEWLQRLVDDPALRYAVSRRARDDALAQFGPLVACKALASMLDQIRDGETAARARQLDLIAPYGRADDAIVVPPVQRIHESDRLGMAEVTVVVSLHDDAGNEVATLDAIREQTLRPLDIIVVGGPAADSSLKRAVDWMTRHGTRFNRALVLRTAEPDAMRNAGFHAADTVNVLPLDAGERPPPDCCATLLARLAGTGASYAHTTIAGSTEAVAGGPCARDRPDAAALALIRKDAWSAVRGYPAGSPGQAHGDIWSRMARHGLWGVACHLDAGRGPGA